MNTAKPVLHGVLQGFFCLNTYFLLPEGYADAAAFLNAARQAKEPLAVRAIVLPENSEAGYEPYELGVCIAPYFIADYLKSPEMIVLEYPGEVYPVQIELLTQQEYNDRLRQQVEAYCPGCRGFGGLNENDSSLTGHFEEITLDGFCPYRWETGKDPRNFNNALYDFGVAWMQYGFGERSADDVMDAIKYFLKLSYAFGTIAYDQDGKTLVLCSRKYSLIPTVLTDILAKNVSEDWQEGYRICLEGRADIDQASVMSLLTPRKIAATRKEFSKYGVKIAIIEYDPCGENSVMLFLNLLADENLGWILHAEPGKAICLVTSDYTIMRVRCAAPMLEAYNTMVTLFDVHKTVQYKVSFAMQETVLDAAPMKPIREKKPGRKLQKAESGRILKRDQAELLFAYVAGRLGKTGCDHTLRFTQLWLKECLSPQDYEAAIEEIQSMGGFCDCELLMNCYQDYDLE